MDCLKCKSALHSIMARPRPKALLEALEKVCDMPRRRKS